MLIAALLLTPGCAEPAQDHAAAQPPRATAQAAPTTRALRVSVWNDTDSSPRGKTEVWLRGARSWFPDLRFGSDVKVYRDRRVGSTDTLYFYPLGRDEPEIPVFVDVTSELCPQGCVRDMVNLEIEPDEFKAWGNPVRGAPVSVARRP